LIDDFPLIQLLIVFKGISASLENVSGLTSLPPPVKIESVAI